MVPYCSCCLCLYFGSSIMLVTYFVNFRSLNDHLFGKELFILFAASAFRKLSSIYVFSYFPFGFEGRIWDLIVSVPDHCLSFYFDLVFTTNSSLIKPTASAPGISDHDMAITDSDIKPNYSFSKPRKIYKFAEANWDEIKKICTQISHSVSEQAKSGKNAKTYGLISKKSY